jgi:hypothetical protein
MKKKRPSGRECALAHSTLEFLKERDQHERDHVAATQAIAPVVAMFREAKRDAIRLIDLERRARFSRLAS